MQIVKDWNNLIIDDFLVIWESATEDQVLLSTRIWLDMHYKKTNYKHIDYPWEYEFDEIYVTCTNDEGKLNYKIKLKDKYLCYVQSNKFVKDSFVEDAEDLFVTSDDLVQKFAKTDFEWKIHDISIL